MRSKQTEMDDSAPLAARTGPEGALDTRTVPATSPTNTVSTNGKPGFFSDEFPRELRDEIYDRLYQELEDETADACNEIECRLATPLVALRLVSRQFQLEYDERCSKNKYMSHLLTEVLPLSDDCMYAKCQKVDEDDDDESAFFEFVGPATYVANMTIVLPACSCSPEDDQYEHTNPWMYECHIRHSFGDERIWTLTEPMKKLRRVDIYLTVQRDHCVHNILLFLDTHKMASALFLGAVYEDIFEFKVLYPGLRYVKGGDNKTLVTWSKRSGLVIEDEAVKQSIAPELAEQERLKSLGSQRRRAPAGGI